MSGILSKLIEFLNTPFCESAEIYDFLTEHEGRMTAEEVLEKVEPFAKENGWLFENDEVTIGNEQPYLVREKETGKVFWYIHFSFLVIDGEKVPDCQDRSLGFITVDDLTGKIMKIKGKRD